MGRPGVCEVPEGSGEQGKMEKTGCKFICGAPATLAVKGLMMMMMSLVVHHTIQRRRLLREENDVHEWFISGTVSSIRAEPLPPLPP